MEFVTLIEKMAIFVVMMVVGYICSRRGVTDKAYTRTTSNLVINVFMFATILKSALSTESELRLADLAVSFLVLSLTIVFCFVVGRAATKLFRIDRDHAVLFELLIAVSNTMFIGVPVAQEILGSMSVFYISLSNIPFNVLLYSYGMWLLKGGGSVKFNPRDLLSSPLIASVLALLIFLVKPPIPGVLRELIDAMSGATMPLSMFVIGTALGSVSLADAFRNKKLYLSSFTRLIVAPLLVALLTRLFPLDPVLRMTCIIIAACPSAVLVSVLSIQFDKDYIFASEGVLQSTALSMLTIPLIVSLLA
ncbi:MAG: AEC family transporter [Oscillospiraceae bacterium]|nr:AEC family transporter [Oscillospiraceae bacterium]